MGVSSMDSFLKTLLVERQPEVACGNDCVVVVDNARCHNDSWSQLPRRLRMNLTLKSDPIHNTPPLTRKKKDKQQTRRLPGRSHSFDNPCTTRWGNTDNKQKKQQPALTPKAALAPPSRPQRQQSIEVGAAPSRPQRQQSIEVTPQHWANMKKDSPSSVLDSLSEELPRMPKRQASVALEGTDCPSLPPMMTTAQISPSSVLGSLGEEGLRMPKRQASVALEGPASLTPPSMNILPPPPSMPLPTAQLNSREPMLFNPSFSSNIKRSSASLLDDDDDDSDDENDAHNLLRSIRSF